MDDGRAGNGFAAGAAVTCTFDGWVAGGAIAGGWLPEEAFAGLVVPRAGFPCAGFPWTWSAGGACIGSPGADADPSTGTAFGSAFPPRLFGFFIVGSTIGVTRI